jgi:hypothetical protein
MFLFYLMVLFSPLFFLTCELNLVTNNLLFISVTPAFDVLKIISLLVRVYVGR